MSDKPVADRPNIKGFDSLSFKKAEEEVTKILQQSTSPQEALKILQSIQDDKQKGVNLVLDQFPSGTVKVRLEERIEGAEFPDRKDIGVLYSDGRIVTRQMPNVLPDLQLDSSAKK